MTVGERGNDGRRARDDARNQEDKNMAVRALRLEPDEILRKKSKPIEVVDDKIKELIEDMLDTMYEANGVGLAAVQIGVLKRVLVMDDMEDGSEPIVLINPEVTHTERMQRGTEGCLSIPNLRGIVRRPYITHVKALNENGEAVELVLEGFLSVVFHHELDHLDGILYTDKAIKTYHPDEDEDEDHQEEK